MNVIIKVCDKCTVNPKTVYGDTDSVFNDFNLIDKKTNQDYTGSDLLEFCIDLGIIEGDLIKSNRLLEKSLSI